MAPKPSGIFSDGWWVSRGQIAPQIICLHFMLLSYSLPEAENIVLPRGQCAVKYGRRCVAAYSSGL